MLGKPSRILHGPWNMAGNPSGLSRAERELGLGSDVAVLERHSLGFPADIDLGVGWRVDKEALRVKRAFLVKAILRYDVFHFNAGTSFWMNFDTDFGSDTKLSSELPLLRRLGKTLIATFQGGDARPPEANPFGPQDPAYLDFQHVFQPQRVDAMLQNCDRVFYVNPDLREWLPGAEFRPYANVDPRLVVPTPGPGGEELVVGHAPSDRGIKGTEHLIAAIESLRGEGVPIRLDLVEGLPHAEALARFARADVAVDQLNLGWYGGFAVEMMAMGRPVLCYIREEHPGDNPFGEELPIVRTSVQTLREDLRTLVDGRERLRELGARSRAFVERHHDPRAVARANLEGLVPIPR